MPVDLAGPAGWRRSALRQRYRDELRRVRRLHMHQDAMLAAGLGSRQRGPYIGGVGDRLAADIENDIAGLKTMLGRRTFRIDRGHYDAFLAGDFHLTRGSQPEAQMGRARRRLRRRIVRIGLMVVRHFAQRQRQRLGFALVQNIELHRASRRHHADVAGEIARVLYRRAIDRGNDVTRLDSGLGRRTAVLRVVYHRAAGLLHAEAVGDVGRHWLHLNAEPAAGDVALVLELGDHEFRGAGRDVETDFDRTARRREDRGVDADHVAVHVESRTAGIALVDGGVDLDVIVVRPGADVASTRGNDSGRHGATETEGIADSDHPIADARRLVGEFHVREVLLAVNLDQRQIGLLVGADHLGRVDRAVIGRDLH